MLLHSATNCIDLSGHLPPCFTGLCTENAMVDENVIIENPAHVPRNYFDLHLVEYMYYDFTLCESFGSLLRCTVVQ